MYIYKYVYIYISIQTLSLNQILRAPQLAEQSEQVTKFMQTFRHKTSPNI